MVWLYDFTVEVHVGFGDGGHIRKFRVGFDMGRASCHRGCSIPLKRVPPSPCEVPRDNRLRYKRRANDRQLRLAEAGCSRRAHAEARRDGSFFETAGVAAYAPLLSHHMQRGVGLSPYEMSVAYATGRSRRCSLPSPSASSPIA